MRYLELLAPARNAEIGIAAIDCGADAVYMAGPGFGARKAAGNSLEDVEKVCAHAHKFGARVFMTVNTIIYEQELEEVHSMMLRAQEAGVDAFIVQDLAVTTWKDITVPLHASTQCSIRTAERARFYESLGFSRVVLERQLSQEQIRKIREAIDCEIECFVHGALCVCYSGQCYLSEKIAGRSANRGECIQACRSLYDLADKDGHILESGKALLSLKDFELKDKLEDMARAGVMSLKIEGRLKGASYVKNVVKDYSDALDRLVAEHPGEYARTSFGRSVSSFASDTRKTFNRSYTSLYFDGQRGKWNSVDGPKSMGEPVGTVTAVKSSGRYDMEVRLELAKGVSLRNGDGFSFQERGGAVAGFRGDICQGNMIRCKSNEALVKGMKLYRNISTSFEKELDSAKIQRKLDVSLGIYIREGRIDVHARSQDGRELEFTRPVDAPLAENSGRMLSMIEAQLSKSHLHYDTSVASVELETAAVPFLSASFLNGLRRELCEELDKLPCIMAPIRQAAVDESVNCPYEPSYKDNIANSKSLRVLQSRGAKITDENAYELKHQKGAELMRSRYCIRYELGICPVRQGAKDRGPMFLLNNGQKLELGFDCKNCEMTVREVSI